MGSDTAGAGFIFIGCDRSVERDHHAQAGCCGSVFAGAVNCIAATQLFNFANNGFSLPSGDIIKVQGDDITASHVDSFSPGTAEGAADKTADVLQIVLLSFLQGHVCGQGFSTPDRNAQTLIQLSNGKCCLLPYSIPPVVTNRKSYASVILHVGFSIS